MAQPKKEDKRPFQYQIIINIAFGFTLLFLVYWITLRQDKRIVYIDTPKLLINYKGMQEVEKAIKGQMNEMKIKLDTLIKEYNDIEEVFKTDNKNIGAKEKERRYRILQQKEEQINRYKNACSEQIEKENKKYRDLMIKEVNSFITKFAEEKGYTCVISSLGNGGLIYAKKGLDITDDVLEGLNKSYTKGDIK
jgi:outer membrane protein